MEVTWGFQDPRLFFLQLRTDVSDSGSGRSSLRTHAEQKYQRAASAKPFPYPPAGHQRPLAVPPGPRAWRKGNWSPEATRGLCPKLRPRQTPPLGAAQVAAFSRLARSPHSRHRRTWAATALFRSRPQPGSRARESSKQRPGRRCWK